MRSTQEVPLAAFNLAENPSLLRNIPLLPREELRMVQKEL
jgi:hypothetical protein